MKPNRKIKYLIGSIFLFMIIAPMTATAVPMLQYGSNGLIQGISELEVNGISYDVTWEALQSFDDIFPPDDPTFWGDPTGASDAITAINNLFNDNNTHYTDLDAFPSNDSDDTSLYGLFIPHSVNSDNSSLISLTYNAYNPTPMSWYASGTNIHKGTRYYNYAYANFAPAATQVPEPATMLLLDAGLLGLAGIRRRFKK